LHDGSRGCTALAGAVGAGWAWAAIIVFPLIGFAVGSALDAAGKGQLDTEIEEMAKEAEREKLDSIRKIDLKVEEFVSNHPR
jgi:hypothetical protein